ncbi:hypothetical protein GPECTOR_4g1001 [Gonium pectorale]|uniref:Oxysterol-binding protein n=1 Tax=Gonium pectorale TaxID=33097 RepID=A0A150GYP7_GONPE|nr:hypothetical protein GPECTOR_4g1001 [Gonium pectorale]|eukprot:KXZ54450.1 hypothetical protein GPECTOR_4g1001 [Gonium pectorale]
MVFKKLLKGKKDIELDGASTSAGSAVDEPVSYHPDADESGGMLCTNDELLKQQREAIMVWVKSMGKRLLTGNMNLINTPFPVTIFEPRSYLEKLADVWVYPRYLAAASQASDPVERMKLVTTWFVAGLHHAFENWRKPFNPILGETWQASLSDGTSMYMEQISHHPPVSAFHMEGPGGSYRFRGLSQPTVSIVVKYYGFKTVAKGFRYVEFPDGTRIELHYPQYFIKNVVYGSSRPRAEVDGQAILVDIRNRLKTVITFGALKGARSKVLRRADAVHGFIYDCSNNMTSLDGRASTADRADPEGENAFPGAQRSSGADEDDEEFESASETEYDSTKEDAEATEALALAAAQAAQAADAEGRGLDTDGTLEEPGPSGAALPPHAAANGTGRSSMNGGSSNGSGGGGGNGATGLRVDVTGSGKGMGAGTTPSSSTSTSGSFFGMSAFNRMGTLLRLSQAPSPACVDPTPDEHEGVALASIEGSWLSHISIDGTRYWSVGSEVPDRWQPVADPLPSDSRYREDLVELANGDVKGAQRAKEALEVVQRHDKKLREAANGSRHNGY